MTQPQDLSRPDDLKQRYLQASAEQGVGPSERVRQAALAHAQMVVKTAAPVLAMQAEPLAANRWNFSLVASVAIAGMGALLALQFDRSDSEDKAVVLGTPSVTAPPNAALPPPMQPAAVRPPAEAAGPAVADSTAKSAAVPRPKPAAAPQATSPPAAAEPKEPAADADADAIARAAPSPTPSPAPAAPRMKSDSEGQSEKAPEGRALQAAPPAAQNRTAPLADAPLSAPPPARLESAQSNTQPGSQPGSQPSSQPASPPSAPTATMKSRSATAAAPAFASAAPNLQAEALRNAASSGQMGLLEQALQQASTAQINAKNDTGQTPLMLATLGGHIRAVQRLLSAGADPALTNAKGNTAAQMAEQLGYANIRNLLVKQPVAQ